MINIKSYYADFFVVFSVFPSIFQLRHSLFTEDILHWCMSLHLANRTDTKINTHMKPKVDTTKHIRLLIICHASE